jgi:Rho-binding antiterminator
MSDETDYQPIACGIYSGYEVAVMHRDWLLVHWRDGNGVDHIERLRPVDLRTCNKEEFMIAVNVDGKEYRIRLDRIVSSQKIDQPQQEGGQL